MRPEGSLRGASPHYQTRIESGAPRCLWIARYIPHPMDAGAQVYSAQLAQSLADAGARVRFLGYGDASVAVRAAPQVQWISVPAHKRPEWLGLASRLPLTAAINATRGYARLLDEQLRERWDVIVLDSYGAGWALDRCRAHVRRSPAPPLLVHVSHNHEAVLWRSMAREAQTSPLRRLALWQNALKVTALERRLVRETNLLTTITAEDRASLGAGLDDERTLVLTPGYCGAHAPERTIDARTPRRIALVGSFHWVVKQENLTRFLQHADPFFAERDAAIDIIGDVPDELRVRLAARTRATRFHGFVQDPAQLLANARFAVVPEAIGGGFKLKFLDYVFARTPVATLTQAAAGLPEAVRRACLQRPTLPELIAAIAGTIDDFAALNDLQRRAYTAAEAAFRWEDRGRDLLHRIERARRSRTLVSRPIPSTPQALIP